jgi:DNA-directed RNA polymerase specialized sigma54-like protein
MYSEKTAFEKYLIEQVHNSKSEAKHYPEMIANMLIDNLTIRGNLVWQLLEATGDTNYTKDTFVKAANLVLDPDFLLN